MCLLDIVSQAVEPFSEAPQVRTYMELRGKLQNSCPEGWYNLKKLELEHWNHFGGIPQALDILRNNLSNNPDMPESMSRDIQLLIGNEYIKDFETQAKELARFVDSLSSYFLKPEVTLQGYSMDLPSVLRRSLLNIKGYILGSEELRRIKLAIAKGSEDTKEKAELYEREMLRRSIILPILPEAYDLVIELSRPEIQSRRALIATKQLIDMLKIVQELLFQLMVYGQESLFHADGEAGSLQFEEKPFGRLVQCHMVNIPPLMIPGQILRFIESSATSFLYVAVLSVNWHYNGETQESTIDLTGIDLEQAGPNLLSRFN